MRITFYFIIISKTLNYNYKDKYNVIFKYIIFLIISTLLS
jgi:hypothetical protein